ncbi:MAG TPA: hypothetical protein CFH81_00405 [Sulfurovum sp. UBA12169]|nr:MAG TPA: hypothetical protein CFH81_00405 [Sulfurovum sp. UBA12169]
MPIAEIKRRIANIIAFGTVSQVKSGDGKALVRVKVMDLETDWLPVSSLSNGFKKHWIPTTVGEQCIVLRPFGESSSGIVFRSIFNRGEKEPAGADESTEIIEYSDGTRVSYSTASGALNVECVGVVTIKAASVVIDAPTTFKQDVTADGNITAGGSVTDSDGDGGA